MSFKAVKVVKALCELYRDNLAKMEELDRQLEDPISGQWSMLNTARGYYTNVNQLLSKALRAGGVNPDVSLDDQILTAERTMALCERRGWPADWQSRMAYLVEEASEYFAALRGKGSQNVAGEGGDLLNCVYAALGVSGVDPVVFEDRMVTKVNELWDAPRRPGEHYETNPKPTRLTKGWSKDLPPTGISAVWLLWSDGQVYPASCRAWFLVNTPRVDWYWEDQTTVKQPKNILGWMQRELSRPREPAE